jgi:hypothetical protein
MKWEQSDSSRFREYHQKTGGKLVAYLRSVIPMTTGNTIESVALEAKFKEGGEFVLRQIDDILAEENRNDDAANGSFASM